MTSKDLTTTIPGIMCAFDDEIRILAEGMEGLADTVIDPYTKDAAQELDTQIIALLTSSESTEEGEPKRLMLFGSSVEFAFRAVSNVMSNFTDQTDPATIALAEEMMAKITEERQRIYGPELERARLPLFLDELPPPPVSTPF